MKSCAMGPMSERKTQESQNARISTHVLLILRADSEEGEGEKKTSYLLFQMLETVKAGPS